MFITTTTRHHLVDIRPSKAVPSCIRVTSFDLHYTSSR